jgi:hypothetical protein
MNHEPRGERCPTCCGSGLVWRRSTSNRHVGNASGEDCMAAFRCPTCPDDGSGNSVGTGRVPAGVSDEH